MAASASCTGTPSAANSLAVSVLPMPIEPVSPMTKGLGTGERPLQRGPEPRRHFRFDAKKCLERWCRLMHQHAQPVDCDMPARPCLFQQFGLERIINDVEHSGA